MGDLCFVLIILDTEFAGISRLLRVCSRGGVVTLVVMRLIGKLEGGTWGSSIARGYLGLTIIRVVAIFVVIVIWTGVAAIWRMMVCGIGDILLIFGRMGVIWGMCRIDLRMV